MADDVFAWKDFDEAVYELLSAVERLESNRRAGPDEERHHFRLLRKFIELCRRHWLRTPVATIQKNKIRMEDLLAQNLSLWAERITWEFQRREITETDLVQNLSEALDEYQGRRITRREVARIIDQLKADAPGHNWIAVHGGPRKATDALVGHLVKVNPRRLFFARQVAKKLVGEHLQRWPILPRDTDRTPRERGERGEFRAHLLRLAGLSPAVIDFLTQAQGLRLLDSDRFVRKLFKCSGLKKRSPR